MGRTDPVPSGTVTLLFTDVQGSTRLWESEPEPMAAALRRHDEILRAAIERAGGFVFKTVGDAFCAAFATAQAALQAVLDSQVALAAERWPTSRPVLVRMGMHTGVCEERDNDYFGPVVNRTARLEAVAHGGQVLISGATAELLSGALPDGVALRDLGQHRLKDLGRPEQVFQLQTGSGQDGFPPLGSLSNPGLPNNLPSLPSAFIGRERELSDVAALAGAARLITLTGAGGCGKTRLALQAAADQLEASPDGVWLAELASLTDGERVAGAVAAVLGLAEQDGQPMLETVIEALAEQNALILLDNCEHVIDAAAKFGELVIRGCPRVRILATSREPLGIEGERVYRVPSLSVPPDQADTVGELAGSDAVQLFAQRARSHDSQFVLDETAAPLVAMICRRLDGIPLALELAAARLSSMSLRHLSERLDQRFRLLTGGSRNAMPRQQTLQATVDWSFSLLSGPERDILTRLSVFTGGFELEAAEAVCTTEAIDALDVTDLLGSLVDKSLVVADRAGSALRYRLLETIRQYGGQELLRLAGEAGVIRIRDRQAAFYLGLAEAAAPALTGPGQGGWLRRLDPERDNLRAAFAHLAAEGRDTDVMRLGVAVRRFALSRGLPEVITSLRAAASRADPVASPLLTEALLAVGELTEELRFGGTERHADAWQHAERALAMARDLGDTRLEARALGALGAFSYFGHDLSGVQRLAGQAVEIARGLGDAQLLGEMLSHLSIGMTGEQARPVCTEALACFRRSGDDLLAAIQLQMICVLDLKAGRIGAARMGLEQAMALTGQLGDEVFGYYLSSDLGILLLIEGRHAEAVPVVWRCLLLARRTGLQLQVAEALFCAACCTGRLGDPVLAARLHGIADRDLDAEVEDGMVQWSETEQRVRAAEQARLRERMGEAAFEQAYRSGAGLTRLEALELALRGRPAPA